MRKPSTHLLAIESSCDDTSVAILENDKVRANIVASQAIHSLYGGVVPELASRAHMQHIVAVCDQALQDAGISLKQIDAIAYTRGPGLMGSLLVGVSFAKSLSLALGVPLIEVNHMEAHVLAHLIDSGNSTKPEFPFICLTVSGGHTQFVLCSSPTNLRVLGETLDDAAGEAFDKCAKMMGLPYPGGPEISRLAEQGAPRRFDLPIPQVPGYDFSFSGLKTAFLNLLQAGRQQQENFVEKYLHDLCASLEHHIVKILLSKFELCAAREEIGTLALAGGVSANKTLRTAFLSMCQKKGWQGFILPNTFTTDNAAMIGIAGLYKYADGNFSSFGAPPLARMAVGKV